MLRRLTVAPVRAVVSVLTGCFTGMALGSFDAVAQPLFDIQGCSYSSWSNGGFADPDNAGQLPFIRSLGAGAVYVDNYANVNRATGQIYRNPYADDFAGIPGVLARSRALGLRTAIRVFLLHELQNTLYQPWRPPNVPQFFADYKALVLNHAQVARDAGSELLIIGQEMNAVTGAEYRPYWLDIIASVRTVFAGQVTYGYLPNLSVPITPPSLSQELSFWDQLDYIALSVYHPLSFSTAPTVNELINGWYRSIYNGQNLIENLRRFHTLTGKRVLLTEIGYRSVDGAATNPGNPALQGAVDFQEQVDLFTAMFTVMSRETSRTWFAGMFVFNCVIAFRPAATFYSTDADWGWRKNYALDGKPAADVVRQAWGGGPDCTASPSPPTGVTGSVVAGIAALQWTPAPGATSYLVQAGPTRGSATYFNASVGNVRVVSAPVPTGFTAYARVFALNACGQSGVSEEVLIQ